MRFFVSADAYKNQNGLHSTGGKADCARRMSCNGPLLVVLVLVVLSLVAVNLVEPTSLVTIDNGATGSPFSTSSCDGLVPDIGYIHFTMSMPNSHASMRNSMSLCAVDSALQRKRPDEKVVVWTVDAESHSYLNSMRNLFHDPNLLICDVTLEKIFADTPLQSWNCNGKYCKNNNSNALRLALLYKFGGVYLDMDVISLRSSALRVGNLAP